MYSVSELVCCGVEICSTRAGPYISLNIFLSCFSIPSTLERHSTVDMVSDAHTASGQKYCLVVSHYAISLFCRSDSILFSVLGFTPGACMSFARCFKEDACNRSVFRY